MLPGSLDSKTSQLLSQDQSSALGFELSRPRTKTQTTNNELAILVMGVTGSGKSTFISRLTDDEVGIGHSLESCTVAPARLEVTILTMGQIQLT
jgi:predicted GTPase